MVSSKLSAHPGYGPLFRLILRTASILCLGLAAGAGSAAPPYPVNLILNPTSLKVDETGTATFQVSLDAEPADNVTLAVDRFSGDTDLSVKSGATLSIPRTAWKTPVAVTLQAAKDGDNLNGKATLPRARNQRQRNPGRHDRRHRAGQR